VCYGFVIPKNKCEKKIKKILLSLLLHSTASSPLQIGGYDIPKGTTVFGYIYNIARNPEYWKDPDVVSERAGEGRGKREREGETERERERKGESGREGGIKDILRTARCSYFRKGSPTTWRERERERERGEEKEKERERERGGGKRERAGERKRERGRH
jgi:hypothetical protein